MKSTRNTPVDRDTTANAADQSTAQHSAAKSMPDARIGAIDAHIQDSPRMLAQRRQIAQISQTAMPVQRKSLEQATLAGGLALVEEGKRTLVGDGRDVNIYYRSADVEGDRTDGLVKAASLNADVGKKVHDWGQKDEVGKVGGKPWAQNDMYTPANKSLEAEVVPNVDPYFLYVTIRYGRSEHKELEQLDVVFQHAPKFTGYVEQIMDTGNKATKDYPSMFDLNDEVGGSKVKPGDVVGERNLKYSNSHHRGDLSAIATQTGGDDEKSLDAYTKIAGEGARWQAVRAHARALKDSTRFYTADPAAGTHVFAVNFVTLWKSWSSAFGKQYDISNATFASKLINNRGDFHNRKAKRMLKTSMTGDDYNLDS